MGRTPQRVVDLLHAEIPAKISRNKFCIKTGINQNSIDKYMAGIAEPTQTSLEKLAAYFGEPVSRLRGDPVDEVPPIPEYMIGVIDEISALLNKKYPKATIQQMKKHVENAELIICDSPDGSGGLQITFTLRTAKEKKASIEKPSQY